MKDFYYFSNDETLYKAALQADQLNETQLILFLMRNKQY